MAAAPTPKVVLINHQRLLVFRADMRRHMDDHPAEQEASQKTQSRISCDVVIHRTCVTPDARNGWSNGADSVLNAITKLVDLRAMLIAQFRKQFFNLVIEFIQMARLIHRVPAMHNPRLRELLRLS